MFALIPAKFMVPIVAEEKREESRFDSLEWDGRRMWRIPFFFLFFFFSYFV